MNGQNGRKFKAQVKGGIFPYNKVYKPVDNIAVLKNTPLCFVILRMRSLQKIYIQPFLLHFLSILFIGGSVRRSADTWQKHQKKHRVVFQFFAVILLFRNSSPTPPQSKAVAMPSFVSSSTPPYHLPLPFYLYAQQKQISSKLTKNYYHHHIINMITMLYLHVSLRLSECLLCISVTKIWQRHKQIATSIQRSNHNHNITSVFHIFQICMLISIPNFWLQAYLSLVTDCDCALCRFQANAKKCLKTP